MTLRHMKILVEVYRQNSVTKAAQALHLSQPSVSLALRELEDYYGVTLFERVGRRISPTECGREFYGYAVHVVSLMDELETRMRNWDAIGTVRIGATVTIGTYLLPELVRQYQAEFPALHVDVQVCRASQVEQLVLDNRIDLGLIETQQEHEELVAVPFSRDELQAIVPPAAIRPAVRPLGYPSSSMDGPMILPMAAAEATPEPETAPKKPQAAIAVAPRPPGNLRSSIFASFINRGVLP